MSTRRVDLLRLVADAPALEPPGLLVARNVLPTTGGKAPAPGLVSLAEFGALAAYARGALGTADKDGSPENFAADETALYRIQSGALTDISRAAGYASLGRWEALVMQSDATGRDPVVIFTNFDDPIQGYVIGVDSLFSDLTPTVADPDGAVDGAPRARHCAVVGDFLVLGDTYDDSNGHVPEGIWWSAIGNCFSFPIPGTSLATSVQSGRDTLRGSGGAVTRIISGRDAGAILRERAIHRFDYIGGDLVWNRQGVDDNHGAIFHHLAVGYGSEVLFWSEAGWCVWDGTEVTLVGRGIIDNFFRNDFASDYAARVSTLVDANGPRCFVGYTGEGHTDGTPNRVLVWDYQLREFGVLDIEHDFLVASRDPGPDLSMDREPSPIPDQLEGGWDDIVSGGGTPGAYDTLHQLGQLTGSSLEATLETGDLELVPGRRAQLSRVYPFLESDTASAQAAAKRLSRSALAFGAASSMNQDGYCPLRADGRYHRVRVRLPAGWTGKLPSFDIVYRETAGR